MTTICFQAHLRKISTLRNTAGQPDLAKLASIWSMNSAGDSSQANINDEPLDRDLDVFLGASLDEREGKVCTMIFGYCTHYLTLTSRISLLRLKFWTIKNSPSRAKQGFDVGWKKGGDAKYRGILSASSRGTEPIIMFLLAVKYSKFGWWPW